MYAHGVRLQIFQGEKPIARFAQRILFAFLFLLLLVGCGARCRIPTAFRISVDAAKRAAAPAIAEAHKNNWTVAVALLDTADNLVYYEKMATPRHWRLRLP